MKAILSPPYLGRTSQRAEWKNSFEKTLGKKPMRIPGSLFPKSAALRPLFLPRLAMVLASLGWFLTEEAKWTRCLSGSWPTFYLHYLEDLKQTFDLT